MNWLKLGRAFSWIDSRWLRITIILLAASTMLWMYVLGEGNFASKFFRGLFFSLQFIVLNKDIDPGIDPLPFSALTFAQFALPFTASVALIGSLFQERMMPYWVRRAVAQLVGHHVIIGYGELGKRLASELVDAGSTVLAVDLSAQTKISIGRAPDNPMGLNHPMCSRYHAEIERVGDDPRTELDRQDPAQHQPDRRPPPSGVRRTGRLGIH